MLSAIFSHPFTWGLIVGLFLLIWVWIGCLVKQHAIRKQVRELEKKARTLEGTLASISASHSQQLDEMKKLIDNQKVTIQLLQEKPGRKQERELRLYAQAYTMMLERAPGFAQAWQDCVREIQSKEHDEQEGKNVFLRPLQDLVAISSQKLNSIFSKKPDPHPLPEPQDQCGQAQDPK